MFVRSGTDTILVPWENTRFTFVPSGRFESAGGSWLITRPVATLSSYAELMVPTSNPASCRICVASSCVLPTTEGTGLPDWLAFSSENTTTPTTARATTTAATMSAVRLVFRFLSSLKPDPPVR